jgi:hypothetical protein
MPRRASSKERQDHIKKILSTGPKTPEQIRTALACTKDILAYDMEILISAGYVTVERLGMREWLYSAKEPIPELAHIYSPPVKEPITGTRLCQPSGELNADRGVRKNGPRMTSSAWQTMID